MQVQLATLCDCATDYQGKLCILGAFDTLCSPEFPVAHPQCSLAVRFIFGPKEKGVHTVMICFKDPAGQNCMPPIQQEISIAFPSTFVPFVSRNLVLNLQQLRIERPGTYHWEITIGSSQLTSIPLQVTLFNKSRSAIGPAG